MRNPIFILMVMICTNLVAEDVHYLQYDQIKGQVLHADALVDETVYINGYFSHRAEIDEFSVSKIIDVSDDGIAKLESSFRTIERVGGLSAYLEWISSEKVRLERDSLGFMSVPENAARPVLRNVPQFPDYPVKPGDSWSLPAEEVHVLRIHNVLYGPYRGPIQVLYRYMENEEIDGHQFARIAIEYSLHLPVRENNAPIRLISGRSSQELLWDIDNGRPEQKEEDFEFLMLMSDGRTQEFIGTGMTTYRLTDRIDRPHTVESLLSQLESVPGIEVKPDDEGILLSVIDTDRILFEPESSILSRDQKYRLEKLARSLSAFPERDILITGHTADYGTFEGRKVLSRDRASVVADILFPEGRTGSGRLFLRGAGNTEPLGSDRENRRVEILILD